MVKKSRYARGTFIAAALLLGVASAAFAQSPSTRSGQNATSSEESKNLAKHKLESMGYTDPKLTEEKHGWQGTAMKDGKRVNVEIRQDGSVNVKQ